MQKTNELNTNHKTKWGRLPGQNESKKISFAHKFKFIQIEKQKTKNKEDTCSSTFSCDVLCIIFYWI